MWIDSDKQFADYCTEAERHPTIGIDLEFQGEGRYTPQLCLIQLAAGDNFAAVDPFKVNPSPLRSLLANPDIRKVFHAGMQDIAILHRETDVTPVNVFDTQIAAAFLGFGESVGYAALVARCLRVTLDKRQRFTEWTRRPLSEAQIEYALNDVRYLLTVADMLTESLRERNRLEWVDAACVEMTTQALRKRRPETAYLRLGRLSGLSRRELGVLRALAAWREETARQENRPVGSILSDDALRHLCFSNPKTEKDFTNMRGLRSEPPRRHREGILAAIQQGRGLPEEELPPAVQPRDNDSGAEAVASILSAVVRARAAELDLAPTLLATRDDLVQLGAWVLSNNHAGPAPDIQALSGWRSEAIGDLLRHTLSGKVTIRIDRSVPGGLGISFNAE